MYWIIMYCITVPLYFLVVGYVKYLCDKDKYSDYEKLWATIFLGGLMTAMSPVLVPVGICVGLVTLLTYLLSIPLARVGPFVEAVIDAVYDTCYDINERIKEMKKLKEKK